MYMKLRLGIAYIPIRVLFLTRTGFCLVISSHISSCGNTAYKHTHNQESYGGW